ncbi:hypothetical protein MIND_01361300 [Mycena indigotica]|uniref:Protein kinase domain-containing protein n=1 Tax=Mycena indigotica TaxID=2126181 RepID=A0A8H6VVK3_9AGAR|nr:uncharacterized protein MIND_01361300 [Mycena indigotica]KAF7289869.1 hypothetical protein MIND_01361300 [Mycena indigotica]
MSSSSLTELTTQSEELVYEPISESPEIVADVDLCTSESICSTDSQSAFRFDDSSSSLEGSETDATSTHSDHKEVVPLRAQCEASMATTPDRRVWAHRKEDLKEFTSDGTTDYWSPSMVFVGQKLSTSSAGFEASGMSLCVQVYGKDWNGSPEEEPSPRKLKVWPAIALKAWSADTCHEELGGVVDDTVALPLNGFNASPTAIPKLEQPMPTDLLPDTLRVIDPNGLSGRKSGQPAAEEYIRVYPRQFPKDTKFTADLRLIAHRSSTKLGNHSEVYPAELTLDERFEILEYDENSTQPTRSGNPATVRVMAKVTDGSSSDRSMLENEAEIYAQMQEHSPHLSEHWSGFHVIKEARRWEETVGKDVRVPATAVVPQFYGYYIPTDRSRSTARPLILLEDCGQQIDTSPHHMTKDQQMTCHTLIHRLWGQGVAQGSIYARNMLIQPGPLTQPPWLRSFQNPSFRIIDFGRGEWIPEAPDAGVKFAELALSGEERRMRDMEQAAAVDAVYGGSRRRRFYGFRLTPYY